MASDQVVGARDVLAALMQVRRLGSGPELRELEQQEPDLTEFLLEETTAIHQQLLALGGNPKRSRRVWHRIQTLNTQTERPPAVFVVGA